MNGRKMKRLLVVLLTFCILMTQGSMMAFATEGATTNSNGVPEGIILNYREAPQVVDSSFANEARIPAVYGTLPTSYSASAYAPMEVEVRENHDAGVREQNPYGTCWAHAAMSIAESSYIINENVDPSKVDFNEYPLVHYAFGEAAGEINLFGGDYNSGGPWTLILKEGGNNLVSLCMLASWHGASDSSQSTYGDTEVEAGKTPHSVIGHSDVAHMENGYVLTMPDMSSSNYMTDMNVIKQMIMEYGSVEISYYAEHSPEYFQASRQYYPEEHVTNHAVTVVGWDDSVSASSFTIAPPGDGAWIVKNSWGSDWNSGGYFYLSYYDATIYENAFAFDFVSGDNYDNNYQYDGSGNYYGYIGGNYGQITAANAFVADSNETLAAVGFFTRSITTDYEIHIYRDLEEGANPNTGTLVLTQSGSETYVGYHTVELNAQIPINKGERYAVVVTLKGDSDEYMLFPADVSDKWSFVEFSSLAKAGESYVGTDVSNLKDVNPNNTDDYYMGKNVRIKAFTNERSGNEDVKVTEVKLNHTTYQFGKGSTAKLEATVLPAYASNVKVTWSSSNPNVVKVDQNGNITAVEKGTAVITATAQDGGGASASCTITVTNVLVNKLTIYARDEAVSTYTINGIGDTMSFYTKALPYDATNPNVSWSSSNPTVATINENGTLKAISRGVTFITATAKDGSGVSATCLVAVQTVFVDSIKMMLDGQETTYIETSEIGKVYDFDVEIIPEETESLGIKWTSSDTSVATVDQNGKVKIVGDGSVRITGSVTIDGDEYEAECYIVVDSVETTFKVQHYVMNVNGTYELAKTETKTQDKDVYTYSDFVKAEYNDGQTLSFSHMKENGYPVIMFYPNEDGTSVVQLYYERQMTPVYVLVELEGWSSQYVLQEAYYVGYTASIDANWIKEKTKDSFSRTGEMEIQNVIVEQGNTKVTLNNGKYSFVTPVNTGGVMIRFVVAEKITYKVEHHVMNENGSYVLAKSETLKGYQKDSYPVKNLIKSEYNTGDTYFKTLTVNDSSIAGLDINTSIRLENGAVVKVYYDRAEEAIPDGWNQADDGNWYYYRNGRVDTSVNGITYNEAAEEYWYAVNGMADFTVTTLAQYGTGWWYVKNGKIDFTYFGLAEYDGDKWYVKNGQVNLNINGVVQCGASTEWYYFEEGAVKKVTGLYQNTYGWWYIKDGQLDFTYFGLAEYGGYNWYVKNGQLDFSINGVVQCGTETDLYYFKNGAVQNVTGLYSSATAYYYVKNGKVDFTYTGLASNSVGYWYVKNGQLDFTYFGVVEYAGYNWYIKNGQLNFNINGLAQCGGATDWYYFKGGAVQNVTGLYSNTAGYWYVKNGKIDFNYTGLASNSLGYWYVQNGTIDFTYCGVGENAAGTWYIEKGKVDFTKSGILLRGGVWYYFKNGAVQRVDTVAENSMGWWAVKNGIIDFEFDGIAGNAAGLWYCVDSRVDFSYNGTVEFEGHTYKVVNGRATIIE